MGVMRATWERHESDMRATGELHESDMGATWQLHGSDMTATWGSLNANFVGVHMYERLKRTLHATITMPIANHQLMTKMKKKLGSKKSMQDQRITVELKEPQEGSLRSRKILIRGQQWTKKNVLKDIKLPLWLRPLIVTSNMLKDIKLQYVFSELIQKKTAYLSPLTC